MHVGAIPGPLSSEQTFLIYVTISNLFSALAYKAFKEKDRACWLPKQI